MSLTEAPVTSRMPMAGLLALFTAGLITTLTEALPAGVLPQMSADIGVSEPVAGQTVSIYAIGTLLTAIPVALATSSWPRRRLLVTALVGFLLANLVTALSGDFTLTMAARFVAGVSSGVTWGLIGGYSQRLVSDAHKGRAMAIAMAGTPVALSFGIPVGTYLGQAVGWRMTFGIVTILSALLIIWTVLKLPNFAGQRADERLKMRDVLRLRGLRTVLLVTGAYVIAHSALYTYASSFLGSIGMEEHVQYVLLDFGVLSVVSVWLTGLLMDNHHRKLVICSIGLFTLAALALGVANDSPIAVYLATAMWGLAFGGVATLFQSASMNAAGKAADFAQSMLVTMWNIGIAGGGVIGGALLTGLGAQSLTWAVVVVMAPTMLVVVKSVKHAFPAAAVRAARETTQGAA
ncbi:putative MFS family arabinose efflux permease [Streptomyces sp. T12]|uniref:MFS transporter n=1 Tax=Streptomyces sp. T12 TaxID=477697 RepID=UPI0011A2DC0B|nr:MFS transporter [Streptomyces sp. T12]TWD13545.1 putative MFS family arabinose efflux permease [Streptomyces sp. T12]